MEVSYTLIEDFKSYLKHVSKQDDYSSYYYSNASTGSDFVDSPCKMIRQSSESYQMLKDIENFIEKNMTEMHKALQELKLSFEEEINSVDGK